MVVLAIQEAHEFSVSLGYIVKYSLKKKKKYTICLTFKETAHFPK
jgi:hypothetical protein